MICHILQLKFKTECFQHENTIATLPKASVAQTLFLDTIFRLYLFAQLPRSAGAFIIFLNTTFSLDEHEVSSRFYIFLADRFRVKVSEMRVEFFPPKEDIILVNSAPSEFYIVVNGAVVSSHHKPVWLSME